MAKKPLSPATEAVWEAFNLDEPGVFVDYGNCLAAALRAAAEQGMLSAEHIQGTTPDDWENGWNAAMQYIQTTAKELEGIE